MYTFEIFKNGIEYLNITDVSVMLDILDSNAENLQYIQDEKDRKQRLEDYKNRFVIPHKITKKAIREKIKECNRKINNLMEDNYENPNVYYELMIEELVEFRNRLKRRIDYVYIPDDKNDILRAKEIPIHNFIQFNSAGFAPCLWHSEKTGSMKYYPKDNRVHCFGCGKSGDILDVVQQIHNCDLPTALRIIL